jgi:DNA-binding NtrC family response regulator
MISPLNILLADDEDIIHETIGGYLTESGHSVNDVFDGHAALRAIKEDEYDLALVDLQMPGMDGMSLLAKVREMRPEMSVAIITGHGNMDVAIQALRLGVADFLTKPVKLLELDAVLMRIAQFNLLRRDRKRLRETIKGIHASEDVRLGNRSFLGTSSATRRVQEQIRQAVDAGCDTILIIGETGTGKEVVAREIHFRASSPECPFIAVSCPALPDSLVESELFGHVKGAFTGATEDRPGCFEQADGGTLFLDEVADLSTSAQAALLRVLETRTLRRIGSSKEITVHVRVIAATNAPLEDLLERREFRPDLFYRLNVYTIHLQPLRQRREDIIPLAEHFLSVYTAPRGLHSDGLSEEAKAALLNYDFPGNARELRNIVERSAILCRSGLILPEHLSLPECSGGITSRPAETEDDDQERMRILNALEEARWNRRQAAESLGMPYSTLRYKIQKLGIS